MVRFDMTDSDRPDTSKETIETVAAFDHRYEAEHAHRLLEEQGIHAIIWSDDAGGIYPQIGYLERYQIRVLAGDLERSRELLREFSL